MKQQEIGKVERWFLRELERAEDLGGPSPSEAIETLYGRGVSIEVHDGPTVSDSIELLVCYSETSARWMPQCEVDWVQERLMLPDLRDDSQGGER